MRVGGFGFLRGELVFTGVGSARPSGLRTWTFWAARTSMIHDCCSRSYRRCERWPASRSDTLLSSSETRWRASDSDSPCASTLPTGGVGRASTAPPEPRAAARTAGHAFDKTALSAFPSAWSTCGETDGGGISGIDADGSVPTPVGNGGSRRAGTCRRGAGCCGGRVLDWEDMSHGIRPASNSSFPASTPSPTDPRQRSRNSASGKRRGSAGQR